MAILLAARVAERIRGTDIRTLVERAVFQPLQMQHSAQRLGRFKLESVVSCQTEHAAPEAEVVIPKRRTGIGTVPGDANSVPPWGGTHASAPDLAGPVG